MDVPVQLRRSNTAGLSPTSLLPGELAINYADNRLFWSRPDGTINSVTLTTPVGGTAEYASASAFPTPGVAGRLYCAADTNRLYRYSADSVYVEVGTIQGTSTATTGRGHDLIPTLVLG